MNYHKLLVFSKVIAQNLGLSHGRCRYSPTCSLYAKQAFAKHPPIFAIWLTGKRLLKCHPWSVGGYDPTP